MKPFSCFFKIKSSAILHKIVMASCCAAAILLTVQANAQVHLARILPAAPTATLAHPLPYSNFKGSALYLARQKMYFSTFNNPSKSFTMSDGTNLNISLVKNPSFLANGTNVTPTVTSGSPNTGGASGPAYYAIEPDQGWAYQNYHGQMHSTAVDFGATDYSFQVAHIFPGAIYTFDSYMDGTYQTPSESTRNPITIATDNPNTQNNFVQVNNPKVNTIHNAITNMVYHFAATGNPTTNYKFFESNNMADWTLKVNGGGSNSGSTLLNNDFFNTTDRRHHRYVTIDVSKQLFSFFTNPPSNGFYSLTNSAEGTPNLVAVGDVNYGIRLLVTMELTFPNSAEANEFTSKLGYLGYSNGLDMGYLQNHSSEISKISGYEIGGTHAGGVSINANSIQSDINNILSSVNAQNANPISYRLYDMTWDIIGANASTGTFNYISGTPNPTLASASVSINCGADGKNSDTHYYYVLFDPSGELLASYSNIAGNSEWKKNTTHSDPLSVRSDNGISGFLNGSGTFRMVIAKPGSEPPNFDGNFLNPFADMSALANGIGQALSSLSKDDIHPFTLTLTLGFTQQGQSGLKYYNIVWNNQSISTKTNPVLTLHFNYSNGNFFAQ